MTADPVIARWDDLRATLDGRFSATEIEIVRTAFYLGARAVIDATIVTSAGSVRPLLMRGELRSWYDGGIKHETAA